MNWYYVCLSDRAVKNPLIVGKEDFGSVDRDTLYTGVRIENWSAAACLRATEPEDDGDPDDALQNHLGIPVFSARLRSALERVGVSGIQFLPVQVFRPGGETVPGYAIANIVERRAALVRAQSHVDVFPEDYFLPEQRGKIVGLRRVVLNRNVLVDTDVFRLDEYPLRIYVSEKFRRAFDDGGFTGLSFWEVPLVG